VSEGLRERKKRLMREHLSDTAARMFLTRGFDEVRVAEVAAACGVSEKTVFNYFPTKEALLLDRLETTVDALRTGLADPSVPPVEAALRLLDAELATATQAPMEGYRRFGDLIRSTPSLRAYQNAMMDRFVQVAAETLASRTGADPADPEPQIAAIALLGLWRIQFDSLRRHTGTPAEVRAAVTADIRRAAALLSGGLGPRAHDAG
jgi:AcrR family transcriptional regulator